MENYLAIKYFKKSYFWDCELGDIRLKSHLFLIIERVLSQSLELEKDLAQLEDIYPISKIKEIALSSTQIFGNERINFISKKYNLNSLNFINFYRKNF